MSLFHTSFLFLTHSLPPSLPLSKLLINSLFRSLYGNPEDILEPYLSKWAMEQLKTIRHSLEEKGASERESAPSLSAEERRIKLLEGGGGARSDLVKFIKYCWSKQYVFKPALYHRVLLNLEYENRCDRMGEVEPLLHMWNVSRYVNGWRGRERMGVEEERGRIGG